MEHIAALLPKAALMPTDKHRISINLADNEYSELSALAEEHGLSMAWIGHKAIIDLLEESRGALQLPLAFPKRAAGRARLVKRDAAHS